MKSELLREYRADLIAEHQADLAAIDRLIARSDSKVPLQHNGSRPTLPRTPPSSHALGTASQAVMDTVNKIEGEFTRHDVEQLVAEKFPVKNLNPRTVGILLWKLAKGGYVETIREGSGTGPAVYRKRN